MSLRARNTEVPRRNIAKEIKEALSESHQKSNGNATESRREVGSQSYGSKLVDDIVLKFRIILLVIWTGIIFYTIYRTYLASEFFLPWNRDPIMNPSWLSSFLNRGKDTSDNEWNHFTVAFTGYHVWLYYCAYVIVSRLVLTYCPKVLSWISPLASFYLLKALMGSRPAACLFLIPVIYWVMLRTRHRLVIWITTVSLLLFLNTAFSAELASFTSSFGRYYYHVTAAWCIARGISYCFDRMKEEEATTFRGLADFIKYTFYFPLTINGPLILYSTYRTHILDKPPERRSYEVTVRETKVFAWKMAKVLFWTLSIEVLLHYIYFWPLALTPPALQRMDWWALCGVVYWLGQFFQMKYVVMYGLPSAIAEYEGIPMPRLPRCIAYVHRYSVMWKDFDRGLYDFLVQYTYHPTCEVLSQTQLTKNWSPVLKKLIASFFTFAYVYVWHSTQYEVFVWALWNFIGITIERIGSHIKRRINGKYNIQPAVWDLLVEPVLTIPLAVMSIINSAVFCGTLFTAQIVTYRFLTESNYVMPYLYILTHVGVAIRCWTKEKSISMTQSPKST